MPPRTRTQVHDVVCHSDGVLVVLHDDDGVPQVAQVLERVEETGVVTLVEPDRRLIQDVQHAHQATADLGRQANALCFSTGQRAGRPAEREVVQPHVLQEAQSLRHLLEDRAGDLGHEGVGAVAAHRQRVEEVGRLADGQVDDVPERSTGNGHRQRRRPQPAAVARSARQRRHVLLELRPYRVGLRVLIAPIHVRQDPLPAVLVVSFEPSRARLVGESDLHGAGAVHDGLAHLLGQFPPRRIGLELVGLRQPGHHRPSQMPRRLTPRQNHALENGDARIGDHEVRVDLLPGPQAPAILARSVR